MKLICDKKNLSDSLTNIQRAVSSKSSLPVLEGILLQASEGNLKLHSYDLEIGMTTSIPATVSSPGEIVLNAKIFTDMIRKMPADQIEITADEKLLTNVKSGNSEFTILGIPASEFPEMPALTDGIKLSLSQELLSSMIRQTLYAVSTDDSKPIHMGSLFEFTENTFRIVSVDGYRLAIRTEKIKNDQELSFVVPGKTLSEINKMLDSESDQDVSISVGKRHILFEIGEYSVISRLLEGEFLDYHTVIQKNHATEVRIKVRDFIESVDRTSLIISERLKSPLRCKFDQDVLKISCSTTIGRAFDSISCSFNGEPVEIGFNNRYLLDALRATECDEVRILLNGPLSPMNIYPTEGENFLFLVLPVRLKSDD